LGFRLNNRNNSRKIDDNAPVTLFKSITVFAVVVRIVVVEDVDFLNSNPGEE